MATLEKGYIEPLDGSGSRVVFQYNPKELSFKRSNKLKREDQKGKDVPKLEYEAGSGSEITLDLFFDTYESGENVRTKYIAKLEKLASVDQSTEGSDNTKRPPFVRFGWGREIFFKSLIQSLTTKYTMFHPDGQPARASVQIQLVEAPEEAGGQNPTSLGAGTITTHTVLPGETLDLIAFRELGEASLWKHVAETNSIDDPWRLVAGQRLVIAAPD